MRNYKPFAYAEHRETVAIYIFKCAILGYIHLAFHFITKLIAYTLGLSYLRVHFRAQPQNSKEN